MPKNGNWKKIITAWIVFEGVYLAMKAITHKRAEDKSNETGFEKNLSGRAGDKKIHILIISQYFHPETFRINDMAAEWVKRGYKVTVLTGIPNYPMGKFFEGYGYTHRRMEQWNGIQIMRVPLIPRGRSSIGMAANYFSFVLSGWWWKTVSKVKADVVFTYEVSPMTQALIGCWYSRKHHIPHFLYVQDLWPENVETVAGIRNPLIMKPIDAMVDWIYRHTDQIFAASPSFVEAIVNRKVHIDRCKVHYWPQYAEEFYKPMGMPGNPIASFIPDDNSFKIAFTGNIGTAQGLDILPQIAQRLEELHSNVRFIIVGDGRYKETFEADIKKRGVSGFFTMIPRQEAEVVPWILACCDAAFLSFTDTSLWEKTIPAKLQSYMACGMPIIAAVKGEAKRVIEEAECGVCCDIGDIEALVCVIQSLITKDLDKMRRNSRAYAESYFNKKNLMDEMDQFFNSFGPGKEWKAEG